MEPLLRMPAAWLPRDATQLDTYMCAMLSSGRLTVTDTSRALARAVLFPPQWYLAWPAFRVVQLLAIGSLPPSIRREYGFEWTARDARALVRWTTGLRWLRHVTPAFAREWPSSRKRPQMSRSTEAHARLTPRENTQGVETSS